MLHYLTNNHNQSKKYLKNYIAEAFVRYRQNGPTSIPFKDEDLFYTLQDWYAMIGQFSEEEYLYLEKEWGVTKESIEARVCRVVDEDNRKEGN